MVQSRECYCTYKLYAECVAICQALQYAGMLVGESTPTYEVRYLYTHQKREIQIASSDVHHMLKCTRNVCPSDSESKNFEWAIMYNVRNIPNPSCRRLVCWYCYMVQYRFTASHLRSCFVAKPSLRAQASHTSSSFSHKQKHTVTATFTLTRLQV